MYFSCFKMYSSLHFDTFRLKLMEIEQKLMKINNQKNECDGSLSIFNICGLINTDFINYYRFLSSIEIIDL